MADETTAAPMNLVQKLASIRRELKNIPKKGRNTFQNYDFLRAEDIAGEMGDRLAEMNVIVARRNLSFAQNIVITKKENGDERADVHVIVTLDYVFIDGDLGDQAGVFDKTPTGYEEIAISSIGEGRDSGDKAVAKALTNALKYALTQPLMMRVGDDPEENALHDDDKGKTTHQPPTNSRARENRYINGDTSKGEMASEAQRKFLLKSAKSAMGDKEGKAWMVQRMEDLKITGPETFQMSNWQMLLNELNQMRAGQDSQEPPPPAEELDIEF